MSSVPWNIELVCYSGHCRYSSSPQGSDSFFSCHPHNGITNMTVVSSFGGRQSTISCHSNKWNLQKKSVFIWTSWSGLCVYYLLQQEYQQMNQQHLQPFQGQLSWKNRVVCHPNYSMMTFNKTSLDKCFFEFCTLSLSQTARCIFLILLWYRWPGVKVQQRAQNRCLLFLPLRWWTVQHDMCFCALLLHHQHHSAASCS